MNGPELDLPSRERSRKRSTLRTRIGKVELARDAALEQVEMSLENDPRLHDMEIVDPRPVDVRQYLGKEAGLLLVVALKADSVARADDRFQKRLRLVRRHHLAAGVVRTCIQAGTSLAPLLLPVSHVTVLSHDAHLVEAPGCLYAFQLFIPDLSYSRGFLPRSCRGRLSPDRRSRKAREVRFYLVEAEKDVLWGGV